RDRVRDLCSLRRAFRACFYVDDVSRTLARDLQPLLQRLNGLCLGDVLGALAGRGRALGKQRLDRVGQARMRTKFSILGQVQLIDHPPQNGVRLDQQYLAVDNGVVGTEFRLGRLTAV